MLGQIFNSSMPVIPVIEVEKLENIEKQLEKYFYQIDAIQESQKKSVRTISVSEDKRK
jgi:hypothetical protein